MPKTLYLNFARLEGFTASIAAAVKWYELGIVSQEKAAEIAGLSRADFISALNRLHVSPLQYSPEELREELRDAD